MTQKNLSLLELADAWTLIDECLENCAKRGDTKLAELIQASIGVCIAREAFIEHQERFPIEHKEKFPSDKSQELYESSTDVAIRLGYKVPSSYDGALGATVTRQCRHLIAPKGTRYSRYPNKQLNCNLYPAGHWEVERVVANYCISQGFK